MAESDYDVEGDLVARFQEETSPCMLHLMY